MSGTLQPPSDADVALAADLMAAFAERTGLEPGRPPRRYLWTDAFAVCNLLGLARATGDGRWRDRALRLVDQVHHVLGRHRPDEPGEGWLSGLGERDGEDHPTRGGLRIGKPLPERRPGEPFDPDLEWERDGQYFHYLTRWMHALDQVARETGESRFGRWARELMEAACAAFAVPARGARERLAWKMSVDLSRALVPSSSPHDPVDGLVTAAQLRETAGATGPGLEAEIGRLAAMIDEHELATADPLGIGGLLTDVARAARLVRTESALPPALPAALLAAARTGLLHGAGRADLERPVDRRLAFRELGLAIGLRALETVDRDPLDERTRALLDDVRRHADLGDAITTCWRRPEARASATWAAHRDIDDVMLATALAPEGYVVVRPASFS